MDEQGSEASSFNSCKDAEFMEHVDRKHQISRMGDAMLSLRLVVDWSQLGGISNSGKVDALVVSRGSVVAPEASVEAPRMCYVTQLETPSASIASGDAWPTRPVNKTE